MLISRPTAGDWELSSLKDQECCLGGSQSSGYTLVSTHRKRPGMLRRTLLRTSRFSGGRFYPDLKVYVARLMKDGSTAMARPCERCLRQMKEVGVKEMIYTTDEGWKREFI